MKRRGGGASCNSEAFDRTLFFNPTQQELSSEGYTFFITSVPIRSEELPLAAGGRWQMVRQQALQVGWYGGRQASARKKEEGAER
jgi:hypothetical protein